MPSKIITNNYKFNTGQKTTFYNHGFITRVKDADEPTKRLKYILKMHILNHQMMGM